LDKHWSVEEGFPEAEGGISESAEEGVWIFPAAAEWKAWRTPWSLSSAPKMLGKQCIQEIDPWDCNPTPGTETWSNHWRASCLECVFSATGSKIGGLWKWHGKSHTGLMGREKEALAEPGTMDLIQMIFHFYWFFFGFSANSIAVTFVETPDPYASKISWLWPWFIFALIVAAAKALFAVRWLRGMNILQVVKTIWQHLKANNNVRPVDPWNPAEPGGPSGFVRAAVPCGRCAAGSSLQIRWSAA
jgi:hypothetical protein